MNRITNNDLVYYTFSGFESTGLVRHGFSTRLGGVSGEEYGTLNLGLSRGDSDENIKKNYEIFLGTLGIDAANLVFSAQTHTTNVVRVFKEHCGNGFTRENEFNDVDGFVTNEPQTALVTFYADCVPIFLLDPINKAIGLAHAGWRGTLNKIAEKTVELMAAEFGSKPGEMLAGIGPSICPYCFETDEPVFSLFEDKEYAKAHVTKTSGGKALIDLWGTNKHILESAGLSPKNIEVAELCTKCNSDIFYSHRVLGEKRGSLAAIMELV